MSLALKPAHINLGLQNFVHDRPYQAEETEADSLVGGEEVAGRCGRKESAGGNAEGGSFCSSSDQLLRLVSERQEGAGGRQQGGGTGWSPSQHPAESDTHSKCEAQLSASPVAFHPKLLLVLTLLCDEFRLIQPTHQIGV